jgi:hypothetical protein
MGNDTVIRTFANSSGTSEIGNVATTSVLGCVPSTSFMPSNVNKSSMGGSFVKLIGVGAINVARRAARPFSPRRHHIWRARVVSSQIVLAREGARAWARWGGGDFVFLLLRHAKNFARVPTGNSTGNPLIFFYREEMPCS